MPRPRRPSLAGMLVGGLFGGLIGGPPGAAIGGLAGAAASQEPVPLEEAIAAALRARGLQPISIERETLFSVRIVFEYAQNVFRSVRAGIAPRFDLKPEQIEDAIYEEAERRLEPWRVPGGG